MKKILITLVLAIGLISTTNAQTKTFCFSDVFGYYGTVTATWAGVGYWTLSGSYEVFTGTPWTVSGYLDKGADQLVVTISNPTPDGCTFYTDYFEYVSYAHGGGVDFTWTSYCPWGAIGSGSGTLYFSLGECAGRLAASEPHGPAMADPSLSALTSLEARGIEGGVSLFDVLTEPVLNVVRNGENNFEIGYELGTSTDVSIDIYNQVGQIVATVVSGNQTAGFYKTNWNASDAQNGMYIAVMRNGTETISTQFVK